MLLRQVNDLRNDDTLSNDYIYVTVGLMLDLGLYKKHSLKIHLTVSFLLTISTAVPIQLGEVIQDPLWHYPLCASQLGNYKFFDLVTSAEGSTNLGKIHFFVCVLSTKSSQ